VAIQICEVGFGNLAICGGMLKNWQFEPTPWWGKTTQCSQYSLRCQL